MRVSFRLLTLCSSVVSSASSPSRSSLHFNAVRKSSVTVCTRSLCTMSTAPPPVVIQARKEHKATVIFLHGLGDQADGWASLFQEEIRHDNVKYILPNAPSRPITRFGGERMPAWFDRLGMGLDVKEDEEGIEKTAEMVNGIIQEEVDAGLPSERVIVGGFSQGGAMSLYVGLSHPQRLGAIVCLSSYLVLRDRFPKVCTSNIDLPIFMAHGTMDEIVPLKWAQDTNELIRGFNKNCNLTVYKDIAHNSSPREHREIKRFISSVFEKED